MQVHIIFCLFYELKTNTSTDTTDSTDTFKVLKILPDILNLKLYCCFILKPFLIISFCLKYRANSV